MALYNSLRVADFSSTIVNALAYCRVCADRDEPSTFSLMSRSNRLTVVQQ
jgi:hypothetical protein